MATDIDPVASTAATRERVRALGRCLQVAFGISTLAARQLAQALDDGTVRFSHKPLNLQVAPDNEIKPDLPARKLEKQQALLKAWLNDAVGLPDNWAAELIARFKPGTTLVEWLPGPQTFYAEHDFSFAPPPKNIATGN